MGDAPKDGKYEALKDEIRNGLGLVRLDRGTACPERSRTGAEKSASYRCLGYASSARHDGRLWFVPFGRLPRSFLAGHDASIKVVNFLKVDDFRSYLPTPLLLLAFSFSFSDINSPCAPLVGSLAGTL